MPRHILIVILLAILVLGAVAISVLLASPPVQKHDTSLQVPPNMGGTFTLTNQDGQKVSTSIYKDKYKLIYFGFTHCPAICPTELQKISQALHPLDDEQASRIQPILVSVDPERDTPQVLKDYVPLFPMNLVAFTGTQEEIDKVKRQFRVYSAKVDDPNASEYSVDHSSYIYLLDPSDRVIALYRTEDDAEMMTQSLLSFLRKK